MTVERLGASDREPHRVLLVGPSDWVTDVTGILSARPGLRTAAVGDAADALDWLGEPNGFTCVVSALDLPSKDGFEFIDELRTAYPELPVVLYTDQGSEAAASEAFARGASDYVTATERGTAGGRLVDGIRRSIRRFQDQAERRTKARQFDAIFTDPQVLLYSLDPDGRVSRMNRAVQDLLEEPAEGVPLWELDWWADGGRDQIRDYVRRAADGERVKFEQQLSVDGGDVTTVDFALRPVVDDLGQVTTILAEGVDITERRQLEAELRESEELHRVTLNNMTDTVLITDEDGRFTYVCPNVHFIFGYSGDEIQNMGTIDALLGDDPADQESLADAGVLTNIEWTASDKAGREHALLVNAREVDIQGGTTLYSIRDITKRKQREQALTVLQRTSRELLYAESTPEISRVVVDHGQEILNADGAAFYLFDRGENVFKPTATGGSIENLLGPLVPLDTTNESVVGDVFIEGEEVVVEDVSASDRIDSPGTVVQSALFVPVGDHGVFLAATSKVDAFDEVTSELADLLASTAEAALDRLDREGELRARDQELQLQNRKLTRVNRINEIIREIDQALVRAETRSEIEHAVCERLTSNDRFALAWISSSESTGTVSPNAWDGTEQGYLDVVTEMDDESGEPTYETASSLEMTIVDNVADGLRQSAWRREALTRGYQSVMSIPLTYGEYTYGTLSVYATQSDAFDEMITAVLSELAETIASAIASVEQKRALLSDHVVELEYEITDQNCVFLRLAQQADCTLELEGGVQQLDDGVLAYVTVDGAPVNDVTTAADRSVSVDSARVISESESGGLVQLTLSRPFIATNLADHGAALRRLTATPATARMTIHVPTTTEVRAVDDVVSSTYTETELLSQHEIQRSITTDGEFSARFLEQITDRQLEVVRTAFHSGFFDSPRKSTGEEVAAVLDISSAAFYQHTRKVERKLFSTLFEETNSA